MGTTYVHAELEAYLHTMALNNLEAAELPSDDPVHYAWAWKQAALHYTARLESAMNAVLTNTDESLECSPDTDELVTTMKANCQMLNKAIR
jgi:hypothetical protein